MVAEVFAGLSALKSALDIAKGRAAQAELLEEIGELKKRVAEFETWETEKQRYELKEVGSHARRRTTALHMSAMLRERQKTHSVKEALQYHQ
jgi:hypothetical protein